MSNTFGPALAKCTKALKDVTNAEVIYIYIFGDGVPHLHVHLAPHRSGDALSDQMIRGEIVEEKLPNGMTRFYSQQFPALPRDKLIEPQIAFERSCSGNRFAGPHRNGFATWICRSTLGRFGSMSTEPALS